jgi:dGTPase
MRSPTIPPIWTTDSPPDPRGHGDAVSGATARERFHEALRRLIDALVSGLVEGTAASAARFAVADAEAVRHLPCRLAAFTAGTAAASQALKQFLYARVYAAPALAEERQRSVSMIGALFGFFIEDPRRLPEPYARLAETDPPHRVVCDYIAGMTDAFCRGPDERPSSSRALE